MIDVFFNNLNLLFRIITHFLSFMTRFTHLLNDFFERKDVFELFDFLEFESDDVLYLIYDWSINFFESLYGHIFSCFLLLSLEVYFYGC